MSPQAEPGRICAERVPGHPNSVCHLRKGHKSLHYANLPGCERPRARWATGDDVATYPRPPRETR